MTLSEIALFHLVLVDRRRSYQQYFWVVRLNAWMSDDVCEILSILFNRNIVCRCMLKTSIIGAKENKLSVSDTPGEMRDIASWPHHESHFGL